jgi:serine/threonine protein kinase
MRLAIAGSKESGVETAENKSQEPPSSTTPTNNEKKHSEENDDDNNDGSSSLPQVTAQVQSYMVLGTRFDVPSTFSILNSVGSGAYGVVAAARDSTTDDIVAIKKIERAFEHQVFTKRTLRELKLLRALKHENIIGLKTILRPLNTLNFDEIYCVFELMETDLASIIKSPQPLSEEHCQFFLYQILRGLKYIHSRNVIHRDLKPRNLLVNSNCDLKICDFGLARCDFTTLNRQTAAMTDYVATRWYRAPEVILTWEKYTKAIDMWSVGCIFAELMGRQPIFPGVDSSNQIQLIVDVLGYPKQEVIDKIRSEKAKSYIQKLPRRKPTELPILFPHASPDGCDLLRHLLSFDPQNRATVNEAIQHPYLTSLHFMDDEPVGEPLSRLEYDFEHHFLTSSEYRELLLMEIAKYYEFDDEEEGSNVAQKKEARSGEGDGGGGGSGSNGNGNESSKSTKK